MLHFETIEPATLDLLRSLQTLPQLNETRLVGGTALALQLGHRKSVDLDFFGKVSCASEVLRVAFLEKHDVTVIQESRNINIYTIDNVKVDTVNYTYDWIEDAVPDTDLRLAGLKDIAAMKINAVIGRGTRKDFVDVFFLLQHFSLAEMLDLFIEKYPEGSLFLALKSLVYFEDAERYPMPVMLQKVPWATIKKTVLGAVRAISL